MQQALGNIGLAFVREMSVRNDIFRVVQIGVIRDIEDEKGDSKNYTLGILADCWYEEKRVIKRERRRAKGIIWNLVARIRGLSEASSLHCQMLSILKRWGIRPAHWVGKLRRSSDVF